MTDRSDEDARVGDHLGREDGPSSSSRGRAALELVAFVAFLEMGLWSGSDSGWLRGLAVTGIVVVCGLSLARRWGSGLPLSGGDPISGVQPWAEAATATLVGCALLWVVAGLGESGAGVQFDFSDRSGGATARWWGRKLVVVVAQQLALQRFVLPLCRECLSNRTAAIVLSSLLFAGVHLPNDTLACLVGPAALVWCVLGLRSGRLAPVVASHLVLAVLARVLMGDAILDMRVGAAVVSRLPYSIEISGGESLRVHPHALEGFVDSCVRDAAGLSCLGWAADLDRGSPLSQVLLLAEREVLEFEVGNLPRPDVARSYGRPELEASGFRFDVAAGQLPETSSVRIFGRSVEGVVTELQYAPEVLGPLGSGPGSARQ